MLSHCDLLYREKPTFFTILTVKTDSFVQKDGKMVEILVASSINSLILLT